MTNDDGFGSPGLEALEQAFGSDHEVWVVAPNRERSGHSHSITMNEPLKFTQVGDRRYSCSGTPVDCVLIACSGALPELPDVVISGINIGLNVASDIIYSGTVGAARQAVLMGIPGIAVSQIPHSDPEVFLRAGRYVATHLVRLLELWNGDHFINVNFPILGEDTEVETEITTPGVTNYLDKLDRFESYGGSVFFFLSGDVVEHTGENCDSNAINSGKISVSPVYLHPINHSESEESYRERFGRKYERKGV